MLASNESKQRVKKILWVSPRWLLPINDGARQATDRLLKLTKDDKSYEVDLLVWSDVKVEAKSTVQLKVIYGLNDVLVLRRFLSFLSPVFRKVIFTLLSGIFFKPLSVFNFFSFRLHWLNLMGWSSKYDIIVFDAPHGAFSFICLWRQKFYSKLPKYILRAQNLETQVWKGERDISKTWKKCIISFQTQLMKSFEGFIVKESTSIACVSENDAQLFRRFFKSIKAVEIPVGYDFGNKPFLPFINNISQVNDDDSKQRIFRWGFLGKLDWAPNSQGLIWFLQEVWPLVKENSKISLCIAGSGKMSAELQQLVKSSGVQFLGFVSDITDFYNHVDGVIIPIFYGGGTRVKAIEAGQQGKVLLSTSLGVNGLSLIPDEEYLLADNKESWIEWLSEKSTKINSETITQKCFIKLYKKFDLKFIKVNWLKLL